MKKIAISIGDPNGIGLEIMLRAHETVLTLCEPVYCMDEAVLSQALKLLGLTKPVNFLLSPLKEETTITPGMIQAQSGAYSFASFKHAIALAKSREAAAVVTLPIHKEAWHLAGLSFKGHTDYLRAHFNRDAIMMLGCDKLFVALFTEHMPLHKVPQALTQEALHDFLVNLYESTHFTHVGVLGLNPHAGDGGVLGDEEPMIVAAIKQANATLRQEIFFGPLVPDTAFTPRALQSCNRIVALYHDQGLAPLKALFFEESINISLNLPIVRTSVDHGTAFDIAYKDQNPNTQSYINAVIEAIKFTS